MEFESELITCGAHAPTNINQTRYPIPFSAELVHVLGPEEALRSYGHRRLIDS